MIAHPIPSNPISALKLMLTLKLKDAKYFYNQLDIVWQSIFEKRVEFMELKYLDSFQRRDDGEANSCDR